MFFYNKAINIIKILGIKFKHTIDNPLRYEKICSKAGIKTLLFVRTDGIGDFIFDLPYIKYIKASKKYKDYKIILMGNSNNVQLGKKYASLYIDDYIKINHADGCKRIQKDIKNISFTTIINPIDSKLNTITELAIKDIKAKEKICHKGFFCADELKTQEQETTDIINNYTKVIDTGEKIMFVGDRCHLFFELLLEENIPYAEKLKDIAINPDINSDFIVVSPFSRSEDRIYSPENFAKIIDFITVNFNIPVLIIGDEREHEQAEYIKYLCCKQNMIYNMAGKLTIQESILYIRMSKLLVANETGTVHIAQNHNVRTVCISNGSYMGTFQPYSGNESYVTYVYPDNIFEYIKENNLEGNLIKYDINKISPDKVNLVISDILTKEKREPCLTPKDKAIA